MVAPLDVQNFAHVWLLLQGSPQGYVQGKPLLGCRGIPVGRDHTRYILNLGAFGESELCHNVEAIESQNFRSR